MCISYTRHLSDFKKIISICMVRVGVDVDAGVGAGVGAVEVFTLYVTPCLFTH